MAKVQNEAVYSMQLTYHISYEEAYEAFYVIADKWGKKAKGVVSSLLGVTAVVLSYKYMLAPEYIGYSVLALLCACMIPGVLYMPHLRAKKGAKKIQGKKGSYFLRIQEDGAIVLKDGRKIVLNGDKDARAVETEAVFAIRPNREATFCIPKRVMKPQEASFIRKTLGQYMQHFNPVEGECL